MDTLSPSSDIAEQLLHRYGNSSAPQHRHLCATAAATRSIIQSESLPLSPLSYFAASISTLSDHSELDANALAALSAFLSIVIPLVQEKGIAPAKAKEAVDVVVRRISACDSEGSLGNSSARALIKCLGLLLGFCDLENWDSVECGFRILLDFAIDKRPKVRKCAQDSILTVFKSLKSSAVVKKSSKLVYSLLKDRMSLAAKVGTSTSAEGSQNEIISSPPQQELMHVMNVVKMVVPHLSARVCDQLLVQLLEGLSPEFSPLTRHILDVIEVVFETAKTEVIVSNSEHIIMCLVSYISLEGKHPVDIVLSAANLAKRTIDVARTSEVSGWITYLPPVIGAVASLLNSEATIALQASEILKELIKQNIDHKCLLTIKDYVEDNDATITPELRAIKSACAKFDDLLTTGSSATNEHLLAVISVLFLKLGDVSYIFMKSILVKLGEAMNNSSPPASDKTNLRKCVGYAVLAMGPEKILSTLPISLNLEDMSCSNAWLLSVLKEYVVGSSLGFFMEHFLPLAESLHLGSQKVGKSVIGQDLCVYADKGWDLLPAFCRYPTDISKSFRDLAKVLVSSTKDYLRIENVAMALQMLVNQNKSVLSDDEGGQGLLSMPKLEEEEFFMQEGRCKHSYSKKTATKNMKTLASCSKELLQAFVDVMFDLSLERREYVKDAVGCLASITEPSIVKNIYISSLKRLLVVNACGEDENLQFHDEGSDEHSETNVASMGKDKRLLLLDLAISFVDGASEDLIHILFKVTKHLLEDSSGFNEPEAYYTLSQILERHPSFCSAKFAEVVDLLLKLKSPSEITMLKGRFSCFRNLLIHALKVFGEEDTSDELDSKAFLILNEIILTLKDSKEEGRKAAYDVLTEISSTMQKSYPNTSDGPYHKLITMLLGYLTGSSPHMKSGSVSALSLLVYNDSNICVSLADTVPEILALLHSKTIEVIKAVLGFVKVLVSSLQAKELQKFLPDIVDGILRWSSISRNHFREKVTVVLEIMMRKCGKPAVRSLIPQKYEEFFCSVAKNLHGKSSSKDVGAADTESKHSDVPRKSKRKREQGDDVVSTKEEEGAGSRKRKKEKHKSHNHNVKEPHLSSTSRDSQKSINQKAISYHDKCKVNQSPLPSRDRNRKFQPAQRGSKSKHGRKKT